MIRTINRRYFEIWGTEEAQNVFLKTLLTGMSILFLVQSVALTFLALRKPVLVAIGPSETRIFNITPPGEELLSQELKRLVSLYVQTHYNWDYNTIEKAHAEATRFVSEKFVKSFMATNADQLSIAKEKKITERVYLSGEIQVDLKLLAARVEMDRIFTVNGIHAAGPLTLDVSFEYGPRTEANPEGIYITGEKVVPQHQGG